MTKDKGTIEREVDLGSSGSITLYVSENRRHLLIRFHTVPRGLDKTGLNGFIDALEKIRKKMDR
jgi:hypothetical protein